MTRPVAQVDDAAWSDYLFFHDNPKGTNFERWHHEFGCRRWFNMVRDTSSHAVLKTYLMGTAKPEIGR